MKEARKMTEQCKEYLNKIPTTSAKALYLDIETADVYFVVGPDENSTEKIAAHKNILAGASDVFKRMFYGPLKETGDIIQYGVNISAFGEFLQFFYKENVKLTIENVAEVMNLGHKYDVSKCLELCVKFLKDTLIDDNICIGLNLALLYEQEELKQFCEKRIIVNSSVIFKSAGFLECHRQILAHILSINLFSCSETEVFEAIMSWVKVASKQENLTKEVIQAHLGDLFYQIRFASMKMKDFATLTGLYGFLFSFDEYKEIVQLIELPIYQAKFFNAKPRELPWNDAIVACDRTISNRPNTFPKPLKRVEATAFSTNEPLLLGSLICTSLIDNRERKSQSVRSKQLVEVTIVEISGAEVTESDEDDDLESLQEFTANDRIQPFQEQLRSGQTEPMASPIERIGENRVQLQDQSGNRRLPTHPSPQLPEMQDEDSEDDAEEELNDENNEDNDDDYDLIFEKTISNLKVYLRSKSRTKILLSKPVLIRPGFLYEIRIQQTPYKQCYSAKILKTKVQLESKITIRFHPDSLHNTKRYGLVTALEFNRI